MDILEPSCGDGVFLEEIKNWEYSYNSITGVEIEKIEAEKSKKIKTPKTSIVNSDFHEFCIGTDKRFDLIIGNPPYIRYQYFNRKQQEMAGEIFNKAHLKYSKLTNAWVSFVVGSSLLLKEKGKIGFVLPAEILQVWYAQQLREFLSHFYSKITIISFKKLVFPDIQQEVVLLLCEKTGGQEHLIEHIELKNASELETIDITLVKTPNKKVDFKANKWTYYFLEQKEIDFLMKIKNNKKIPKLGDLAKVEVGITTGGNEFFTVTKETLEQYNLKKFAYPMVWRSVQVSWAIFNQKDWNTNQTNSARSNLLIFPKKQKLVNEKWALKYLKFWEEKGINNWYKCWIREEWQIIPSLRVSDALFIRRNNIFPKLLINSVNAYTTDTMHRVSVKDNCEIKSLVASYYNSLSLAFAEISWRSHWWWVLELMPSEAEEIVLPYHSDNKALLEQIDKSLRKKTDIKELLKITNEIILKKHYWFTDKDIILIENIRQKLLNRRLNRSKK